MDSDLAAELYASGLTISEVGDRLGVSASTIRRRLMLAGVKIRKRSARRPPSWSQYQRTSPSAARTFHQWHELLADALGRREAVSVRATVAEYLRRTPTKSEITAARRAAHRLVQRGQATVLHVRRSESDTGPAGQYLILVRPGTNLSQRQLDGLAAESTDVTRGKTRRFEPTTIAQDLAESVELLTAAFQAVQTDQLDPSTTQRLAASVDAALENLAAIQRHLKRAAASPRRRA